jgi:hypothetical protein
MSQAIRYSMSGIRAEVRYLLSEGRLRRGQPVSVLCEFFSAQEWKAIAEELELAGIQPHERLTDLIGPEDWPDD